MRHSPYVAPVHQLATFPTMCDGRQGACRHLDILACSAVVVHIYFRSEASRTLSISDSARSYEVAL